MTERPRQLALDLPLEPRLDLEDFLVGPSNEAAYAMVENWPDWPDKVLRLEGPEGAGKTHLAAIWAERAHAWKVAARAVTEPDVPGLVSGGALVVEDADRGPVEEAALFHLLNMARERGTFVLVTARSGPDGWGLVTRDLVSRLRLAPSARIEPPDEALLRALIVKLFLDRQIVVDTSVVDYLARRIERSFAAVAEAVDALDRLALSAGRRVTRAMAATVLPAAEGEGADG